MGREEDWRKFVRTRGRGREGNERSRGERQGRSEGSWEGWGGEGKERRVGFVV